MWHSHGRVSLAGHILWAGKKGEREDLRSFMMTYRTTFQIRALEPPFSSKASRTPGARFIPNASFSHWGTIGRLEELIFMLENLIKGDFHAMGPLNGVHL